MFMCLSSKAKGLLLALIGTLGICLLQNNFPVLRIFGYFVVAVHEVCHSIICLLTGGSVSRIVVESNFNGYTVYKGGNAALILMGGYLGASLIGALIIFACAKYAKLRGIGYLLGLNLQVYSLTTLAVILLNTNNGVKNDAAEFSKEVAAGLGPQIIAVFWIFIVAGMFFVSVYYALKE